MKRTLLMTGLFILAFYSFVFAAAPVIFYSDLESGPKTGGENNKGAYVTVFGKNFGAFNLTGFFGWADNFKSFFSKKITNSQNQRGFRTDDG